MKFTLAKPFCFPWLLGVVWIIFNVPFLYGSNLSPILQVDTSGPKGGFSISETQTSQVQLTLAVVDNDGTGTVKTMAFSNNNQIFTPSPEIAYATSYAWTLASGYGLKKVWGRFTDDFGNQITLESEISLSNPNSFSSPFEVDTASPSGTFAITKIQDLKWSPNARLTMAVTDNRGTAPIESMTFSNNQQAFTPSPAIPYANVYNNWTLTHGSGVKTVWGRFTDLFGNRITLESKITIPNTIPVIKGESTLYTLLNTSIQTQLNASDPDGTTQFAYAVATPPTHGTVQLNGALLTYSPNLDYVGIDNIDVVVSDGIDESLPLKITVIMGKPKYTIESPLFVVGGASINPLLKYGSSEVTASGSWNYASSDESEVIVNNHGQIQLLGNKGATVTVTYQDISLSETLTHQISVFPEADDFELDFPSNDTKADADTIFFGGTQGELLSGDVDWFQFTITSPEFINLYFDNPTANTDFHLFLYNELGQLLASWTSLDGKSVGDQNLPLGSGTYFIQLESAGEVSDEYYTLFLEQGESLGQALDRDNHTLANATQVTLGDRVQERFLFETEFDYYRLYLDRPTHLKIKLGAEGAAFPYSLSLFSDGLQTGFSSILDFNNGMPAAFVGDWQIEQSNNNAVLRSVALPEQCLSQTQIFDFESQIPASFLGNWVRDATSGSPNGRWAMKVPPLGDNQQASLAAEVVTGNSIKFQVRTSSEANLDLLEFYIDDVKVKTWSGNIGWQSYQHSLTPGNHRFAWVYKKDSSFADHLDTAWLDAIDVGASQACVYPASTVEAKAITQSTVSFRYRKRGNDLSKTLLFYVDDRLPIRLCEQATCGEWQTHFVSVAQGQHTFRWVMEGSSDTETVFEIDDFGKLVNTNLIADLQLIPQLSENELLPISLQAGNYYVEVNSEQTGLKQLYTLEFESDVQAREIEPNNTATQPNGLVQSQNLEGQLSTEFDVDIYAFHQNTDSVFQFDFYPTGGGTDFSINLTDEMGRPVRKEDWESSSGSVLENRKRRLRPGSYFLTIRLKQGGNFQGSVRYTLTASGDFTPLLHISNLIVSGGELLELNTPAPLTVTSHYQDGSSANVTSGIQWFVSNSALASITEDGQLTMSGEGTVTIKAAYAGAIGEKVFQIGSGTKTQDYGNLIVVAGGGLSANNNLKTATQYLSNFVYTKFITRGFEDKDIYYMNPSREHDIDGDGYYDNIVDQTEMTVEQLGKAIITWAKEQASTGPLYLYLNDHGGVDQFQLFPGKTLTATAFDQFLDEFQQATNRPVVVVFEACKSGTFLDDLQQADRLIVTSSDTGDSYLSNTGHLSFSQPFFNRLGVGDSFQAAFDFSKTQLQIYGRPYNRQFPQLRDGGSLASLQLGGRFTSASLEGLSITNHSQSTEVQAGEDTLFFVEVSSLEGGAVVSAVITPPDYTPPPLSADLEAPEVSLPVIPFTFQNGRYEGNYSFALNGSHRVVFYVKDRANNVVISPPITLTVSGGAELKHWELFSFPQASGQSPNVFFDTYQAHITTVWSWENGAWHLWSPTKDIQTLNNEFGGAPFSALTSIFPGRGYWVLSNKVLEFESGGSTSFQPTIEKGWNLIGVSHAYENQDVAQWLNQFSNSHSIWGWWDGQWYVHFNNPLKHSFKSLGKLEIGKGYWLRKH